MNDSFFMRRFQRFRNLLRNLESLTRRQRRARNALSERLAFDECSMTRKCVSSACSNPCSAAMLAW
jgi:hypothetical protein